MRRLIRTFKTKKVNTMFFLSSKRLLSEAVKISIQTEEEAIDQTILAIDTKVFQSVAKNSLEEYAARPIMSAPLKLVSFLENLKPNQLNMSGQSVNQVFG